MRSLVVLGLAAVLSLVGACGEQDAAPVRAPSVQQDAQPSPDPSDGPLLERGLALWPVGLYALGDTEVDPLDALKELVEQRDGGVTIITELVDQPEAPTVYVKVGRGQDVGPPDAAYLASFGRGLTEEHVAAIQESPMYVFLGFASPPADARTMVRQASSLASDLANRLDAVVMDEETREVFTRDAWNDRHEKAWVGDVPEIRAHITLHVYPEGELLRGITLGMRKFGAPDLVIERLARSSSSQAGNLLNLAAQHLVERGTAPIEATLNVDIDRLGNTALASATRENLVGDGTGRAHLGLAIAEPAEGDPDNDLVRIVFDDDPQTPELVRQEEIFGELFGVEDAMDFVDHDKALLDASARAQARLIDEKKSRFLGGLEPNENLLVKGPFETSDGGTEWMWVEVTSWKGTTITGVLMNEPQLIPGLKSGATVSVEEGKVFDYIHRLPDGTSEGNTTAELLHR